MGRIYEPTDEAWQELQRRGMVHVTSLILVPVDQGGRTRLSLTRIAPGGTLGAHVDDYEHVFCVQRGHGEAMVGKERRRIGPGDVITTSVNEPHGIWADPSEEILLVAANVYPA